MTDEEMDARVRALSDADVRAFAAGEWSDLSHYRPLLVRRVLATEVLRLRDLNTILHRRCQQAEAAVAKHVEEWYQHGGPAGGNFGRALLGCEVGRLREENERLKKELAAKETAL